MVKYKKDEEELTFRQKLNRNIKKANRKAKKQEQEEEPKYAIDYST